MERLRRFSVGAILSAALTFNVLAFRAAHLLEKIIYVVAPRPALVAMPYPELERVNIYMVVHREDVMEAH